MTTRKQLELAIEAAIEAGGGPVVDEAIALLDQLDGDVDAEDVDREADDGEPGDLPPLMDGGWGYQLGRLRVVCRCPSCGDDHFAFWASPVTKLFDGPDEAVL